MGRQGEKLLKQLVLMVGVPGSGKSTLAQRLVDKGYAVLNADSIRQELWGDAADQREPEKVFEVFYQRMDELLDAARDIVIDNINTNPLHREQIISRARKKSYTDIQLWVLDVPLETCLERNRSRSRNVPDDIVKKMHTTLFGPGRPGKHEGRVVIVRPGKNPYEFRFFLPR
jgi:predicted kinase